MALPEYRAAIAEPKLPKELTEPRKGQTDPKGYRTVRDKYIKIEKFAITITLLSALIVVLLSLATQVTLSNQNYKMIALRSVWKIKIWNRKSRNFQDMTASLR